MRRGFTLIELLVVIAVLGVLAGGIFVAINPLKRINQARDSQIKNDIGQITQSAQAYFTLNQSYPISVAKLKDSGDLKTEPKTSSGASYSIVGAPQGCAGRSTNPCTNMAIFAPINDAKTTGNVWCYRSASNSVAELASSVCVSSLDETNMFTVGNLIPNGSFETGNSNGVADGWSQRKNSGSTATNDIVSPGVDGSVAQRVINAGYTENLDSTQIAVEKNSSYTLTAWVKIISQTANQGIFLRGLLCGSPAEGPSIKTVSGSFAQLTMTVNTGDCTALAVIIGVNAAGPGQTATFDVDAVQVIKN